MLALFFAQGQGAVSGIAFPPEAVWVGVIVIAAGALIRGADGLTSIIDRYRRKPTAEATFATKEELIAVDKRSEQRSTENRDLIRDQVAQLERTLCDKINDNKTNHTEQFGFLRGELHAVRGTMQSLSNEISRAVGRLEGAEDRAMKGAR
jgi:hypothetical protein